MTYVRANGFWDGDGACFSLSAAHIIYTPRILGRRNPFCEGCPITVGSETVCFRTKGRAGITSLLLSRFCSGAERRPRGNAFSRAKTTRAVLLHRAASAPAFATPPPRGFCSITPGKTRVTASLFSIVANDGQPGAILNRRSRYNIVTRASHDVRVWDEYGRRRVRTIYLRIDRERYKIRTIA